MVIDEADFRSRCQDFADAFGGAGARALRGQGVPVQRDRALAATTRACRWTSAPAASWPLALRAGFPRGRIALHGSNKSAGRADHGRAGGDRRHRRRFVLRDRPAGRASPTAAAAPIPVHDPGDGRRRGAHPRVHRHRARGPEVRLLAGRRRRRRGGPPGRRAAGAAAGRPALAHRLADLRPVRLRGLRAPGGRGCSSRSSPSTRSSPTRIAALDLGGGLGIAYTARPTTRPPRT